MDEASAARIRVFRNDPAGRDESPVPVEPPRDTGVPPWGFLVAGRAPEAHAYEPDTPEFLWWQLAAALERGKRLWSDLYPGAGRWIPGDVLPALPLAGSGLNAYYDRRALHFFRDEDRATGRIVQTGESPDIVLHEQGHAILDAVRPDLWDAPHFEVAAFHEAFGDLASIFGAFAAPELSRFVLEETGGALEQSNLVSRLAEELGGALRERFGPGAALPGALRDAVNDFEYVDPKSLPDEAPASELSAEPHSFCRVLTGAAWDLIAAVFDRDAGADRGDALAAASATIARLAAVAAESAPSGADFLGRFARRLVRAAHDAGDDGLATALAERLWRRRLLVRPDVGTGVVPDADPAIRLPEDGERALPPALVRAIEARLGGDGAAEIMTRPPRDEEDGRRRVLRGRRRRDLFLHGAEYGPADGAAVEISDSFALDFGERGYLSASSVHRAGSRDEEDARAFVRFLARRRRIAPEGGPREAARLASAGRTHAVVREEDGVARLRRIWISARAPERARAPEER